MTSNKLKVLMIGLNYGPEHTGIAPYTSGASEGLQSQGFQVSCITAHPHYPQWNIHGGYGAWVSREVINGVAVTRLQHYVPRPPKGIKRLISEVSFGVRVMFARWHKQDAIVMVSPAMVSSALALVRSKLSHRRIPVVVWVQDIYSKGMVETGDPSSLAAKVIRKIEKWLLSNASSVVVIHERFGEVIAKEFRIPIDRLTTIRNWAHVPEAPTNDRVEMRRVLGWGVDEVIVLHTGNMGVKQGLSNVVEAGRLLDANGHNVRFVLMGDGGERELIEDMSSQVAAVEVIPPVDSEIYSAVLAAADVLLVNELSGVSEMALPSKITSYLGSGRPIVAATDLHGVTAHEINASGAGIVVPAGSPEKLVKAVIKLSSDKKLAAELGANGLRYRQQEFNAEVSVSKLAGLLKSLVASR